MTQKTNTDTFERVAALGHFALGVYRVKVIFRDGGYERGGEERAYWMESETYQAIPLGVVAFIDDYKKHGPVDEAKNCNIYDIEHN